MEYLASDAWIGKYIDLYTSSILVLPSLTGRFPVRHNIFGYIHVSSADI